jgi:hypothetical protein
LWGPVLALLEPFALDLWRTEINHWFPPPVACCELARNRISLACIRRS